MWCIHVWYLKLKYLFSIDKSNSNICLPCSRSDFKFWSSSILQGYSFGPLLPLRPCIPPLSCHIFVFSPRYTNAISLFTSPPLSQCDKRCIVREDDTVQYTRTILYVSLSLSLFLPLQWNTLTLLLRPHKLVSPVRSHGFLNVHRRKCAHNITIIKLYGY
jgi:hypothetical protein